MSDLLETLIPSATILGVLVLVVGIVLAAMAASRLRGRRRAVLFDQVEEGLEPLLDVSGPAEGTGPAASEGDDTPSSEDGEPSEAPPQTAAPAGAHADAKISPDQESTEAASTDVEDVFAPQDDGADRSETDHHEGDQGEFALDDVAASAVVDDIGEPHAPDAGGSTEATPLERRMAPTEGPVSFEASRGDPIEVDHERAEVVRGAGTQVEDALEQIERLSRFEALAAATALRDHAGELARSLEARLRGEGDPYILDVRIMDLRERVRGARDRLAAAVRP